MVMEASPSPQSVGREFVRQYYTLLNKAPAHLHRFYNNYSSFVHGGLDAPNRETLPVIGQKQIHNRIQQLNFRDCHAKISQVDAQATLGNGVVVQVTGELSNGGAPMRRFTQTFVLAAQSPKKYYVHNDIFRYQDIVFSDEEGENSGRSDAEEEEAGGTGPYFPPPPAAFPGAFPAPPAPPAHAAPPAALHAPLVSPPAHAAHPAHAQHAPHAAHVAPPAPAAPAPAPTAAPQPAHHLNGHPPPHDDSARHLVAALQASSLTSEPDREASVASPPSASAVTPGLPPPEPTPEPVPEPEREPTPPPQPAQQTAAPLPPEPKTYANLLKSGSSHGGGTRSSPPSGPAAPAAPPAPAPAPLQHAPHAAHAPHAPHAPHVTHAPHTAHAAPQDQRPRMPRPPTQPPPPAESSRRYSDAQQLFLGNLPHGASEEELRALFGRFGAVAELRVHRPPAAAGAHKHPNYGFITYESSQAAHDCLNAAPLYFPPDSADGVKLNVEEKKTRGREAPRRRPLSSHRAAFQPRPAYRR